jgi:hypothetical protein
MRAGGRGRSYAASATVGDLRTPARSAATRLPRPLLPRPLKPVELRANARQLARARPLDLGQKASSLGTQHHRRPAQPVG